MSNRRESDKLLKSIAKEIKEKNYEINHGLFNYIYHKLIFQNVSKEDRTKNLYQEGLFEKWLRKKRNNTNVDISKSGYFCNFVSSDNEAYKADDHIKIYVPLDYEHIDRGVEEIFDFLDENKISHVSKVGKHIRFDDVVVRLINEDDAKKFLEFIKNNKYIQEGLLPPNPFAYNEGNIAIASDGNLSYNSTVANYILLYMKRLKENNALDKANIDSFYKKFLLNYYALTFVDIQNPDEKKGNLNKFSEDFAYIDKDNKKLDVTDPIVVDDYEYVTKLMLESQAKHFNLDHLINHFKALRTKKRNDRRVDFDKVDQTLMWLIEVMVQKNDSNYTLGNIIGYIETGNEVYLTRTFNCRQTVHPTSFRKDMQYMLEKKNISATEYVKQMYCGMFILDDDIINLLKEYIAYAEYKYGKEDIIEYLEGYVTTKNKAYITRDNDFRDRFLAINLADRVSLFMKATGNRIENIIEMCRPRRK